MFDPGSHHLFWALTLDSCQSFAPSLHHTMSEASITSNRSRRPSQEGNTHGAHDQSVRFDDCFLSQSCTPPADNGEETYRPPAEQMLVSSGISNSGPPRQSEPRIQGHTPDDSPDGGLAA
ncbi:hypothetical protein CY34DRAFT_649445 [Suillus luteus UH-Slu-Lm8-n1]|uniref:Uncharacterized protein n=1 Tax=Suillus luteus UH-Slu-Lm8-n1 TaxID=930992 RepID=A0A0C9Z9V6_9AGAM|nr:hypothetical protein CY34DRAFT_649445 [Suillus luteus UH-Slu-Lm8-n1]